MTAKEKKLVSAETRQVMREAYPHVQQDGLKNFTREMLYSAIYHRERAIQELLDHIDAMEADGD